MPSRDTMAPTAARRPQEQTGSEQRMDKHTLMRRAARAAGITQDQAFKFTEAFLESIQEAIAQDLSLGISNFGFFKVKRLPPKERKNYLSKDNPDEIIHLKMGVDVRFSASEKLKEMIREKHPWNGNETKK